MTTTDGEQNDPAQNEGPGASNGGFGLSALFQMGMEYGPTVLALIASGGGGPTDGVAGGATAAGGLLQLADLGIGAANLGLSVAILTELRGVNRRLDELHATTLENQQLLRAVGARVERIDVNVAENNLRNALRYQLGRSIQGHTVNLSQLATLMSDVEKFGESFPSGIEWGFAPGLTLSSDVREMVVATERVLSGVRLMVTAEHNRRVAGDPERVIAEPPTGMIVDLGMAIARIASIVSLGQVLPAVGDQLGEKVYNQFTFASSNDAAGYATWLRESFGPIAYNAAGAGDGYTQVALNLLPSAPAEGDTWNEVVDYVSGYLDAWWRSDAGRIFSLAGELEFFQPGCELWRRLDLDGGTSVVAEVNGDALRHMAVV